MNKKEKTEQAITRCVNKIYPSLGGLEKRMKQKKKMRIYCGYDPTGPTLHLGHLFPTLKLADFQALGHQIIILIGDFTGMIGDPTDKNETRKKLTRKEVLSNSKNYKKLISKWIDFSGPNPAKIVYNSKWNDKLSFSDIIDLTSNFTVQQMIVRDMFQKRIKRKKPIYLHEFLYPLVQGYDSVVMDVDLEVGGNDQLFNMLCGRDLVKALKNREKFVLTTKLLTDSSGKKIGKTQGKMVAIDASPETIYGTIMSWSDNLIIPGLIGSTRIDIKEIRRIEKDMKSGKLNPIKAKAVLAKEITAMCHNLQKANKAEKEFFNVFQKGEIPTKIKEFKIKKDNFLLIDILIKTGLCSSKSEGRRAILQGGVRVDGEVKKDWKEKIRVKEGIVIRLGKRKFAKII